MVLIGAAARNVGKTEFACSIIRKYHSEHEIVGVKVTVFDEDKGGCHNEKTGCISSTSLTKGYRLTEETDRGRGKDTERLAASGADKVYWLRVKSSHLSSGIEALMEQISPGAIIVCESNTLRIAVEPSLFLMLSWHEEGHVKATAQRVWNYADRIVVSDGKSFDLDLEDLEIVNGAWRLCEEGGS